MITNHEQNWIASNTLPIAVYHANSWPQNFDQRKSHWKLVVIWWKLWMLETYFRISVFPQSVNLVPIRAWNLKQHDLPNYCPGPLGEYLRRSCLSTGLWKDWEYNNDIIYLILFNLWHPQMFYLEHRSLGYLGGEWSLWWLVSGSHLRMNPKLEPITQYAVLV